VFHCADRTSVGLQLDLPATALQVMVLSLLLGTPVLDDRRWWARP
jgi:hypothetical protein